MGRPQLSALLESLAASADKPHVVAIANQSGRPLVIAPDLPFDVRVVDSSGGLSRGRNDAFALLAGDVDFLGFPNDDSRYRPDTLAQVAAAFAREPDVAAVAATLAEDDGARFVLPAEGTYLDRQTVWRAVEPALFLRADWLAKLGGFSPTLGTGCPTPWQSGEGTDVLLRLLAAGGRIVSAPSTEVIGAGERRGLDERQMVNKQRRYARGTGYVYRLHGYPRRRRLAIVGAPWIRAARGQGPIGERLRVAFARSVGRAEGLVGRPFTKIDNTYQGG